jgi:hypothetical protein
MRKITRGSFLGKATESELLAGLPVEVDPLLLSGVSAANSSGLS